MGGGDGQEGEGVRVPPPTLPALTLGQDLFLHVVIFAEVDVGFEVGKSLGGAGGGGHWGQPSPVSPSHQAPAEEPRRPDPSPHPDTLTWVRVSLQRW